MLDSLDGTIIYKDKTTDMIVEKTIFALYTIS